jgi:hypothetical protein
VRVGSGGMEIRVSGGTGGRKVNEGVERVMVVGEEKVRKVRGASSSKRRRGSVCEEGGMDDVVVSPLVISNVCKEELPFYSSHRYLTLLTISHNKKIHKNVINVEKIPIKQSRPFYADNLVISPGKNYSQSPFQRLTSFDGSSPAQAIKNKINEMLSEVESRSPLREPESAIKRNKSISSSQVNLLLPLLKLTVEVPRSFQLVSLRETSTQLSSFLTSRLANPSTALHFAYANPPTLSDAGLDFVDVSTLRKMIVEKEQIGIVQSVNTNQIREFLRGEVFASRKPQLLDDNFLELVACGADEKEVRSFLSSHLYESNKLMRGFVRERSLDEGLSGLPVTPTDLEFVNGMIDKAVKSAPSITFQAQNLINDLARRVDLSKNSLDLSQYTDGIFTKRLTKKLSKDHSSSSKQISTMSNELIDVFDDEFSGKPWSQDLPAAVEYFDEGGETIEDSIEDRPSMVPENTPKVSSNFNADDVILPTASQMNKFFSMITQQSSNSASNNKDNK